MNYLFNARAIASRLFFSISRLFLANCVKLGTFFLGTVTVRPFFKDLLLGTDVRDIPERLLPPRQPQPISPPIRTISFF